MMNTASQTTKLLAFFGVVFVAYVCCVLVKMNSRNLPWWNFFYGMLFSLTILCGWGLWFSKRWALWLSLILALAGLGLGLYLAHFAWTFWIFTRPTFFDRIVAVLHPRILVFVLFPVAWLLHFTNPDHFD